MSNKDPLVSIVTPSYNQGEFIEDTLLSVKNQTYPNLEHIVVDGGSTDNTLDILREHENKYSLKWISEPDDGQSDAINKGFDMAKGHIIGWLNSDDVYFYKNTISFVVNKFIEYKKLDVLYGDVVNINRENEIMRVKKAFDWDYERLLRGRSLQQPAVFFKKHVIKKNSLANIKLAMDHEFWLRLGKKYRFSHINKILAGDRIYKETKRKRYGEKNSKVLIRLMKEYGQEFNLTYILNKLHERLHKWFLRLQGINEIIELEKENLAIDFKFPTNLERVKRQINFNDFIISLKRTIRFVKPNRENEGCTV